MKHDYECDRYQAALAAEGPYGDPSIEPTDYDCYCPEANQVTIVISGPDEDGHYRVEIGEGYPKPGWNGDVEYSGELAEILPTSKEVKEWLR